MTQMHVIHTLTPAQRVLVGLATVGTATALPVALANLWPVIGRPVEDQTGSLVLGILSTTGALDGFLLGATLVVAGTYGAARHLTGRAHR